MNKIFVNRSGKKSNPIRESSLGEISTTDEDDDVIEEKMRVRKMMKNKEFIQNEKVCLT